MKLLSQKGGIKVKELIHPNGGVEACEWPLLCRRGAGSGMHIRGFLQSADSISTGYLAGNQCSGLMILKTLFIFIITVI